MPAGAGIFVLTERTFYVKINCRQNGLVILYTEIPWQVYPRRRRCIVTLTLDRNTKPKGLPIKTYGPNMVHLGDYEISTEDFLEAALYVLTNTDLGLDDQRVQFVKSVKAMRVVKGFNKGHKRLRSNVPPTLTLQERTPVVGHAVRIRAGLCLGVITSTNDDNTVDVIDQTGVGHPALGRDEIQIVPDWQLPRDVFEFVLNQRYGLGIPTDSSTN